MESNSEEDTEASIVKYGEEGEILHSMEAVNDLRKEFEGVLHCGLYYYGWLIICYFYRGL